MNLQMQNHLLSDYLLINNLQESNCNVGNSKLVFDTMMDWIEFTMNN